MVDYALGLHTSNVVLTRAWNLLPHLTFLQAVALPMVSTETETSSWHISKRAVVRLLAFFLYVKI